MNIPNVQKVAGTIQSPRLLVLALSTCGFCKRAMNFLQEQGFAFEFSHLDFMESEVKGRIKEEFRQKYGISMAFPTLIIDDEDVIVGFIEAKWRERLNIPE